MKDLSGLFRPKSVAVTASCPEETGRAQTWAVRNLRDNGLDLPLYLVSGAYPSVDGTVCHASVSDTPTPADLVLVFDRPTEVLATLRAAERGGSRAAVLFGDVLAGLDAPRRSALTEFVKTSALAVCGPLSNGVTNVRDSLAATTAPYASMDRLAEGHIAVVSQSGALLSSLVRRLADQDHGFSHICSVGGTLDVGLGDVLGFLADDERTRTVLVYAEGITDREQFLRGARGVTAAGKAIVLLKSGRTPQGVQAVRGHSGSVAGSYAAFRALCEGTGILVADSFDEFVAWPALLAGGTARRRDYRTAGVGLVSGSGAIGAMLADEAVAAGFRVPALAPATCARLAEITGTEALGNPLDLVSHDPDSSLRALRCLSEDPAVDIVVYGAQYGPAVINDPVKAALAEVARGGKEVFAWSAGGSAGAAEPILTGAAVPVLTSARDLFSGLRAISERRVVPEPARTPPAGRSPFTGRGGPALLPGRRAWDLLARYGIPGVPETAAASAGEAVRMAGRLGCPVVLKVAAPDAPHRSKLGLVALGLRGDADVSGAWERLTARARDLRLGPWQLTVQRQIEGHAELLLAARYDPESGPYLLVGLGGIHTELIADVRILPVSSTPEDILRALRGLKGAALLGGATSGATSSGTSSGTSAGLAAAVQAVTRLAALAADAGPALDFVEINPFVLSGDGGHAVDVLAAARND